MEVEAHEAGTSKLASVVFQSITGLRLEGNT